MPDPVRILLIDDNPDDRALALRALCAGLPHAHFAEAGTADQYTRCLAEPFDCVITDFRIGWTDGLSVLADVRQRAPDVPVIMFTNTGNEEVCAQGMKNGLTDYLVKRRAEFVKLPLAVTTALALAEARRTLRERDAQLQDLLERERHARAEAVRANHLKDEFLATVSHELRTPLSAILGWTHILQLGRASPAQQQQACQVIERNARLQVKLIEDLLDMSRIISGTLRIDLGPLDLLGAVRAAVDAARPQAERKRIALLTRFEPAPPLIRGDAHRIEQIVANLLANAVKFTPEGGRVELTVRRVRSEVEIAVADTGAGIAPDFLPHLFDRFRQSDAGPARRHGGLGIGLSVVKSLVEMHGGHIAVHSDGPGRGARFTVSFPAAAMRERRIRQAESARQAQPEQPLAGLRILAVDDDPDTLDIVSRLLLLYGAAADTAPDAPQGLARLAAAPYDILLSDIGMPGMDGFTLIERLRAAPGPNQAVPAVSLTAFARGQDRERALLAGFDVHLTKPVEPGELLAVLLALRKRGPQAASPG